MDFLIIGAGGISQFDYTYDLAGNKTTSSTIAGITNYTYNNIYELTGTTGLQSHAYNYDNLGNRTTADTINYTANNLNQYDTVNGVSYSYDNIGNLISDGTNTYIFDRENKLTAATTPIHSASYQYDAFDRRVSKTVNGVTTYYIYDADEVIAEYNSSDTLLAEYIYGDNIDEVLSMERAGSIYYYSQDGLGSVTDITNASGQVVENYTYDPYGAPSVTSSLISNPYMFTGRRYDEESGLYHYRARAYDPGIGRFLQRDPLGYVDSTNLYSYVVNNPGNWIDPYGLATCPAGDFPELSLFLKINLDIMATSVVIPGPDEVVVVPILVVIDIIWVINEYAKPKVQDWIYNRKPKSKPSGNEKPHNDSGNGKLKGNKKKRHQKLRPGHDEIKKQKESWKPFGK